MTRPRWLPVLLLSAILAACSDSPPATTGARIYAMGTWVELITPVSSAAMLDAAVPEIEAFLRDYERDYYAWGDGELAALNAALATGGRFPASPGLVDLVQAARELAIASGGTFDPAVAPLVEAWGFHDATAGPPAEPDAATIASLLASMPGIATLTIDGNEIASPEGSTQLDLGGIAKGRAVDLIIGRLQRAGLTAALVNAGGDLRVIGARPERPWRVGIQAPRADGTLATIELAPGEAAFTSGDYERYFDTDGERRHHLLDPATGYPATHTQAVTVIADNGTLADAAATAIFIAGPARWRDVAAALGVAAVLRVGADGQAEATAAMRDRLQASGTELSDIIMSGP